MGLSLRRCTRPPHDVPPPLCRRVVPRIRGALALSAVPGCGALTLPFLLAQNHKVDAAFEPAPGRMVVLAEAAPGLPADDPRLRAFTEQVAATATSHLRTNLREIKRRKDGSPKRGQELVDPASVAAERGRAPEAFAALPLDGVARRFDADFVVFVEVAQVRLPDPGNTGMTGALVTPSASGSVRVVDALGRRVFPTPDGPEAGGFLGNAGGRPFAVELRTRELGSDLGDPGTLRRDLADAAGLAVARLFYDWTGPRPGDAVYEQRRYNAGRPQPGDKR